MTGASISAVMNLSTGNILHRVSESRSLFVVPSLSRGPQSGKVHKSKEATGGQRIRLLAAVAVLLYAKQQQTDSQSGLFRLD